MSTSWYYFSLNGKVGTATGLGKLAIDQQILLQAVDPFPGKIYGPYSTQAAAEAAKAAHPSVTSQLPTPGNVEATIETYFGRVAEAILGVVLLAVAANALIKGVTGISPAGVAGKAAATAAVA